MIRTLAPLALATVLSAGAAQATDIQNMTEAERDAFGAAVRAYLLENPHVIVETIERLEARQAEAQSQADLALVQANAEELFNDGYSWVGGNPDGDITLVEFLDYRCGYCRRAHPEVEQLLRADGNIRLIVKELPILGEGSLLSSRFAVATKQLAGDDAYKQVHDALIAFTGEPSTVALKRMGDGLGLDSDAILAHMNSAEVTAEIRRTRQLAEKLQINGTPTFVLEDELLRGYLPAAQMAVMVGDKRGG